MSSGQPVDPDDFFARPAISFSTQPDLKKLFEFLVDPDKTFTFIVGAGASLDAGLPTWARLIENITDLISDDRWRVAAKEDGSELLRKAESSLQLALEDSTDDRDVIIRRALYRNSNKPRYGRLAEVIARLAACLKDRVHVATVNLDTLLEDAMTQYCHSKDGVKVTPVPFFSPKKPDPKADARAKAKYASYQRTGLPDGWDAGSTVLHLHGILEPGKAHQGNIVLTESDFLTYGPAVRNLIKRRLETSHVVFFGVSLTDPNLVSPLWDVHNSRTGTTDVKAGAGDARESFVFSVAAPDPKAASINDSRAYSIKKGQYLSDVLGLHTIFLKSYGQQIQAIAEASLAVLHPKLYTTRQDPSLAENPQKSQRYGHRLKRYLDDCYADIGCNDTQCVPVGEHARKLSDRLNSALTSDEPVSINKILQSVHDRLSMANDQKLLDDYKSCDQYFKKEKFGLFLWLRTTRRPDERHAPYSLQCVGASISQHRESWSLDRIAEIKGTSRFVGARAAFYGSPKTENFATTDGWLLWHSERAVPVSYYPGSAADPEITLTAINVGVITLNSTHNLLPLDNRWTDENPRSIFTMMNGSEIAAINDELARIARKVLSAPLSPGDLALPSGA
jgi:hypothetical protein